MDSQLDWIEEEKKKRETNRLARNKRKVKEQQEIYDLEETYTCSADKDDNSLHGEGCSSSRAPNSYSAPYKKKHIQGRS